jgi:hypothetical protein
MYVKELRFVEPYLDSRSLRDRHYYLQIPLFYKTFSSEGENDPKVIVAPCCYNRIEAMQEWILFDYRILLPPFMLRYVERAIYNNATWCRLITS